MDETIQDITVCVGIDYQKVLRQLQEYVTNDLTPEMDGESFVKILSMICDDQTRRQLIGGGGISGIPMTRLSNYYGHTYGKLARPFPSETVIENIVPFLVINNWFKVFYIHFKRDPILDPVTEVKDYLIVPTYVKTQQVEEHFRKLSSANMFEIIQLKEIIV